APDRAGRGVAAGLLLSGVAMVAGFVLNRNIFNSDNYRYLVGLLVPWSVGFGVLMTSLDRKGWGGRVSAALLATALGVLMTADLGRWYARFGWLGDNGRPVRQRLDDPLLTWLESHPEVTWIEGGYWDVYRLSFLTEGRVRGAPFPVYPNRFPGWRPGPHGRKAVIVRATPEGVVFRGSALKAGGTVAFQARGATVIV